MSKRRLTPHHYNAILLLRRCFQGGKSFEEALKEVQEQCNIIPEFEYTLRAEWELLERYGASNDGE